MKTLELRTSLFRFDPTQLGRAYRVVIGEHYLDAWQALKGLTKKPHPGLPIIALEEMLTVLSGGPVKVNLSPQKDGGVSAILLLKPLPIDTINETLRLWSMDVLRIWNERLEGFEGKLAVTDLVPLETSLLVTPGDISSLAYTVIPWLVGQAMIRNPCRPANQSRFIRHRTQRFWHGTIPLFRRTISATPAPYMPLSPSWFCCADEPSLTFSYV
ncbi:hypothetical protein [Pseudomonas aeruginosa]|uniref:hypothetical protein n=1 Tax=Pseudomonas aeruginosa TaxID=287 RepID=UPI0022310C52|nr:hypothetical protein [Pseudomonas aeruginosa]MCW3860699.1 hypothetical protein [Pseudomonas aeruginosa]MCW3871146.1 hypothetical protein [Pseudomonas aeruginosa]MCW3896883.1 hypothetical protein [Pseudomonas aeruginosa]MCW3954788.1 hypothetical protein [Pseudomonas aeruginosa]